jgi:hypothetical protein
LAAIKALRRLGLSHSLSNASRLSREIHLAMQARVMEGSGDTCRSLYGDYRIILQVLIAIFE